MWALNKIVIIKKIYVPQKKRDVRSSLGLVGYYQRFIKYFSKNVSCLFSLLTKYVHEAQYLLRFFKWGSKLSGIDCGENSTVKRA